MYQCDDCGQTSKQLTSIIVDKIEIILCPACLTGYEQCAICHQYADSAQMTETKAGSLCPECESKHYECVGCHQLVHDDLVWTLNGPAAEEYHVCGGCVARIVMNR